MMRFLLFSVLSLFCSTAIGLTETDRQELFAKNLLKNGGFENGLGGDGQKWTASLPATTVIVTSGSNVLRGGSSATFDSTLAGQTLSYSAVAVPNGLKGMEGIGYCKIMVPSGTATHVLEVTDGTSTLGTVTVTSSTTPRYTFVPFTFPTTNVILRLRSIAANEPLIAIDDCGIAGAQEINVTNNIKIFSTPGAFTWRVPSGVTSVIAQGCGAGGGGGGGGSGASSPSGGGGGAGGNGTRFDTAIVGVTPGATISGQVGTGGAGGTGGVSPSFAGTAGGNGTSSFFGDLVFPGGLGGGGGQVATGGNNARAATASTIDFFGGLGGAGGMGSVPSSQCSGSNTAGRTVSSYSGGAAGISLGCTTSGGGGGGGGASPAGPAAQNHFGNGGKGGDGVAGGTTSATAGQAAQGWCAGGGGGGANVTGGNTLAVGGAGGQGVVVITWSGPPI